MDIYSLPDDIYGILEGKALTDPGIIKTFGPEIGKILEKKFNDDVRVPTLRMSNIGRPLRQLWYELNDFPAEKLSGQTHFKFLYGHIIEALTICLAKASGHCIEREQEEVVVDGIKGHIDGFCDGVLFDVKSASPYSFKKFEDKSLLLAGNDPFGYVGQLSGYAHALDASAAYVAVNKVLGSICVLDLPKERIDEYDITGRITECRRTVASPDVPERCYPDEPDGKSGNRRLGVGCSYCAYKTGCWADANEGRGLQVYLYATGPRFLTNVAREPKVSQFQEFEAHPDS